MKRTQWAALQQERFDLPSLTPALRNLRLLPLKLMSQQLPGNISFVRDRLNVAQQWILLHSSSKIVGLVGPNKRKTNGLLEHYQGRSNSGNLSILSHNVLQVPNIVGFCCIGFQTTANTIQHQCWELLRRFGRGQVTLSTRVLASDVISNPSEFPCSIMT